MKKSTKILIGILTVLPLLFFALYFISIFSVIFNFTEQVTEFESGGEEFPLQFFQSFAMAFGLIAVGALLTFGMLIFYIIHAVKNPRLQGNNMMIIWILIFLLTSPLGLLAYFFVEIWPERKKVEELV